MIERGSCEHLGSLVVDGGANFAVFAPDATRLELCLFDEAGHETRVDLPAQTGGIWHGFVPEIAAGQHYGLRAHGSFDPEAGHRFNPAKLLIDPYARALGGEFRWSNAVFDHVRGREDEPLQPNLEDSAPCVPKSVVTCPLEPPANRPGVPWSDILLYELNVRGFTIRHPAIGPDQRGRLAALGSDAVVEHLRALGVTSIELLPVHAFIDEEFLARRQLTNYWGYNSASWFAVSPRYLGPDGISGFRRAIDVLHDAGIEVILDVVYNHTAEGGKFGPTLGFRGLANDVYYRLLPGDLSGYVNDTGCGNTVDTSEPIVRRLIVDSLRYFHAEVGVDGFRFDLATTLGRLPDGFRTDHPLFAELGADAALRSARLIAEPWDIGPGGYQLGAFPRRWAEWNDQFRDTVRSFWRPDPGVAPDLARRIHGSADIFEQSGRPPSASINYVTSHDGFTLADLVSYNDRHNEANGEQNRDGHRHNLSTNHGVEGPSDDPAVVAVRRRHRLNVLATLLLAQGTPMLLAGDEFGNSQSGNNNAYAQDNAIGWIDWTALAREPDFFDDVCRLARLRRELPLLRQPVYRHADEAPATGQPEALWFQADGEPVPPEAWPSASAIGLLLSAPGTWPTDGPTTAVALLFNAGDAVPGFRLPKIRTGGTWRARFSTAGDAPVPGLDGACDLPGYSVVCLARERE